MIIFTLLFYTGLLGNLILFGNTRLLLNMKIKKPKTTKINLDRIILKAKTTNQYNYIDALHNDFVKLLVVDGPAGSGKTFLGCLKAIDLLHKKQVEKIVITRPAVTVKENIGFLPGSIVDKMDPWTKPIFDIFLDYYSILDIDNMLNNNIIEICPIAFMRGRTFKNAIIIADEMQNSNPNQMKMLTTRVGNNCKLIVTGDSTQSDININNGFSDIIPKINTYTKFNPMNENNHLVKIIQMNTTDIQRSNLTKHIINVYDYKPRVIKELKKIDFDAAYRR